MKRSVHYWDITQCRAVILYRHYGTTCWSHFQRSTSSRRTERL